jgi:4-hydroxy-tetrahydrodipicolinate synthase
MSELRLDGVIAFPVTPMDDRGEQVDLRRFEELLGWLVQHGVEAVVPMGSTGEYPYLTDAERQRLIDVTVATLRGRATAIVGVSALSTQEAVGYARKAARIRADAIMLSVPTYYRLSDREIEEHIRTVAHAADLPLILYNNPYTSLVDLTPRLLASLSDLDWLVAVKEANMDVSRIPALRSVLGESVRILGGGFDPLALPAFVKGATGWTTAMANLVPERCLALHRAAVVDHDLERASQLDSELAALASLLVDFGLAVAVKAALGLIGRSAGAPRRPLLPLDSAGEDRLAAVLTQLGFDCERHVDRVGSAAPLS